MKLSSLGLAQLRQLEGCRLDAYTDEAGVWTIGYGHTAGVKAGDRWTADQADSALRADVAQFEAALRKIVKRPATEGQADALILWAFNVGIGAAQGSTLIDKFNAGDTIGAAHEFVRWINVTQTIALRIGDSGSAVRDLQKRLQADGFSVSIDGVFGTGTETALKAWQRAKGKPADGIGVGTEKRPSANLTRRRFYEVVRFLS